MYNLYSDHTLLHANQAGEGYWRVEVVVYAAEWLGKLVIKLAWSIKICGRDPWILHFVATSPATDEGIRNAGEPGTPNLEMYDGLPCVTIMPWDLQIAGELVSQICFTGCAVPYLID